MLGNRGEKQGQLNVYTGEGNFSLYAYYLSMALVKPELLKIIAKNVGESIEPLAAVRMKEEDGRNIFDELDRAIASDPMLKRAAWEYGPEIIDKLNP